VKPQIVKADKKFRVQVFITMLILLPFCALLYYYFHQNLQKIAFIENPEEGMARVQNLIFWVASTNALISSVLATYLMLLVVRTLINGQYPPPGMRVIKDTNIRSGIKAKLMAALLSFSAIVALSTNLMMYYLHQTISDLLAEIIQNQQFF